MHDLVFEMVLSSFEAADTINNRCYVLHMTSGEQYISLLSHLQVTCAVACVIIKPDKCTVILLAVNDEMRFRLCLKPNHFLHRVVVLLYHLSKYVIHNSYVLFT